MADLLTALYHRLPPLFRNVAASVRGAQLQRARYGPHTDRLRDEAIARERWTRDQWRVWQEDRLAVVLHRAATRVPFYRAQWEERRRRGDKSAWDQLANWPMLGKHDVRASPRAFVADDRRVRQLVHDHTSGTTGTSLNLWISRDAVRAWYALHEARSRGWYGVSRTDTWAILGGQLVTPVGQRTPPFWVWNRPMRQLYLSSYHLSTASVPAYVSALQQCGAKYLLGYPSAMYTLAQGMIAHGIRVPTLVAAVTNAEPLLLYQRDAMIKAFGCPVRETYGMAETVAAANECETGAMHLWPETGVHEVVDDGGQTSTRHTGELVATGLLNTDMPLIRYRTGDRVALAEWGEACACGRTLPRLLSVEGRVDDQLIAPDGRVVGRMDGVFKNDLPICEAQIIQEAVDRICVRVVRDSHYSSQTEAEIVRRIRDRLGAVEVRVEPCEAIPRMRNGKFRAVISLAARPRVAARAAT